MSGQDDAEEQHRYHPPHNERHQIPTIGKFREEKERRQSAAAQYGSVTSGQQNGVENQQDIEAQDRETKQHTEREQTQAEQHDENVQPVDTSEADAAATDPKARRKEQKHRKDERAEREVTDPVTHLPVRIHDLTSSALEEVSENPEPYGSTSQTATGLSNKRKSGQQLRDETEDLQRGHDSMRTLFPPPNFEAVKEELTVINKHGITAGLVGTAVILLVFIGLERLLDLDAITNAATGRVRAPRWIVNIALWLILATCALGAIAALIFGIRDYLTKRINSFWEDEIWDANGDKEQERSDGNETETVAWLNAILGSVWPLINPDLFTSLADQLEDVMQASLPRMVEMVSVNDVGQGSENPRILGVRWLPTGAASQSVTEEGALKKSGNDQPNDRMVPGEGAVENGDQDGEGKDAKADNSQGDKSQGNKDQQTEQGEDGSQQQVAEGLEAEEGDFVNMEVAFAYRARSSKRTMKDRAKDMHLYMAFYLPSNIKIPIWVDLRGIVGTMRLRLQLCPDPPFFSLCTLTFLGQPKVELSCTPLSKHALNIMDIPLISNFVQSSVDAAMAQYVAPKSLNLDLKDMLAGDDFKKDVTARGVLVIHIKRGYDFKTGDTGIPLVKDGSSDPYVSVGWAKFGKPVWSTRLLMSEMEPWWDETAYVLVTPEELNVDERLRVQLWDSDRMTADDDLGRIEVDLKDIMKREESNGKMWHREDGFRALKKGDNMPGQLEWSVGYFSKTRIQKCQLQKQTFDKDIQSVDQLEKKANAICERKLREARTKEGRHKQEADELEQQKAQEMKNMEDAMIISSPPPEGYPSGIFSLQIHQIVGLGFEKDSKTETDRAREGTEEEEEGEGLPSAYCTVIINHGKVFKTRTKPKNAKPFYNATTERYIADWHNAEVFVSVRDARVKEDNPLIGIVHLPLWQVFQERSQVNGFYPLAGGLGYGRIRLSMVWRSVQLQASPQALGWSYGTLEVKPKISSDDTPEDLKHLTLRFHTDLGHGKMYPDKNDQSWYAKNEQSLRMAVQKRYSSCLAIFFQHKGLLHDKAVAFGTLWLRDLVDDKEEEITVNIWKGDFERAKVNALPEPGEKIGSLKLSLAFWSGLGAAHSKWASKDPNVGDVAEVLKAARDNLEEMQNEKEAGVVDGNATDSSSDDEEDAGDDDGSLKSKVKKNPLGQAKELKKEHASLSRRNKGLMQWKAPRTAQWAAHKAERTQNKVSQLFKHHTAQAGIETEV